MHSVMLPSLFAFFIRLSLAYLSSVTVIVLKPLGAMVEEISRHKFSFTVRLTGLADVPGGYPQRSGESGLGRVKVASESGTIPQFSSVLLVADEAADCPDAGVEDHEVPGVAGCPDGALSVGWHEFPVPT